MRREDSVLMQSLLSKLFKDSLIKSLSETTKMANLGILPEISLIITLIDSSLVLNLSFFAVKNKRKNEKYPTKIY